jgi:hypothetical protein
VPVLTATQHQSRYALVQLRRHGHRFSLTGAIVLVSLVLGMQNTGRAGMNVDEYLPPPPPIADEHEARIQRERIAREIEAAREAAKREAQAREREQERIERERASRPLAVQLIEARCASCHEDNTIFAKGRSRLGWESVVLRMKWLNGADLKSGERSVIASWLAAEYGVSTWQKASEILALLGSIVAAVWVVRNWNVRRKKEMKA